MFKRQIFWHGLRGPPLWKPSKMIPQKPIFLYICRKQERQFFLMFVEIRRIDHLRCSVNLVVFGCGVTQHADKVCEHSTACGCIFCYPRNLWRARLLNVANEFDWFVSSDVTHGQQAYFKRQNELKSYLIKVKVHTWNSLYFQTIKQTSNVFRMRYMPLWYQYFDKALLFYRCNFFG